MRTGAGTRRKQDRSFAAGVPAHRPFWGCANWTRRDQFALSDQVEHLTDTSNSLHENACDSSSPAPVQYAEMESCCRRRSAAPRRPIRRAGVPVAPGRMGGDEFCSMLASASGADPHLLIKSTKITQGLKGEKSPHRRHPRSGHPPGRVLSRATSPSNSAGSSASRVLDQRAACAEESDWITHSSATNCCLICSANCIRVRFRPDRPDCGGAHVATTRTRCRTSFRPLYDPLRLAIVISVLSKPCRAPPRRSSPRRSPEHRGRSRSARRGRSTPVDLEHQQGSATSSASA